MPKKMGINPKAAEARERKAEAKKSANEKAAKAAEDAYWADDDKQLAKKKKQKVVPFVPPAMPSIFLLLLLIETFSAPGGRRTAQGGSGPQEGRNQSPARARDELDQDDGKGSGTEDNPLANRGRSRETPASHRSVHGRTVEAESGGEGSTAGGKSEPCDGGHGSRTNDRSGDCGSQRRRPVCRSASGKAHEGSIQGIRRGGIEALETGKSLAEAVPTEADDFQKLAKGPGKSIEPNSSLSLRAESCSGKPEPSVVNAAANAGVSFYFF